MDTTRLPQDIIELILDEFDHTSLRACSTISRPFLPLCRARIFKVISINRTRTGTHVTQGNTPSTTRCGKLRQIFTETPCLVDCVRILKLSSDKSLGVNPDLGWILGQLKHLTELFLTSSASHPIEWESLGSSVQSGLIECFRLPTMDVLSIEQHQGIPISVLDGATPTRFNFRYTSWSSSHPPSSFQSVVRPTYLQSAGSHARTKQGYRFLHEFFMPPYPFSFELLMELDIEVTSANKAVVTDVFNGHLSELRHLKLRLEDGEAYQSLGIHKLKLGPEISVDLSPLTSLQSLGIRVDLEQFFSDRETAHKNFWAMIGILTSLNSTKLQLIHLDFWLDMDDFAQFHWECLDDVVHDMVKRIPSLHLKLEQCSLLELVQSTHFECIRDRLPKLTSQGSLIICDSNRE
ncbi:hypothetical protein BDN72DRAFT_962437 [Pluteus cervinus]|uniref:Uncharacterized protein n=1 Tax=Pluteus cervinus TaxID=181527 RepID=A0ACD3AJ05_9AGAR|nr:hypothetical protein BDN72DRAFT_962437 [Pluteus cervinus]